MSKFSRNEKVARWIELIEMKRVSRQVDEKREAGRLESWGSAASRELGISESDARRAVNLAAQSPEAKKAARETSLDNNRCAASGLSTNVNIKAGVAEPIGKGAEKAEAIVARVLQRLAAPDRAPISKSATTAIRNARAAGDMYVPFHP